MSYVQISECIMCRLKHIICAGFSLCYEQFAATNHVASLRASLASDASAQFLLCAVYIYTYVYIYKFTHIHMYTDTCIYIERYI